MKQKIINLSLLFYLIMSAPIVLYSATAFAEDRDFRELRTGTYSVSGNNPGGGNYQGEARITKNNDSYKISWRIGSSETYQGIGILDNGIFSVAYVGSNMQGVVSYRVVPNGLEGRWTLYGGTGAVMNETLRFKD